MGTPGEPKPAKYFVGLLSAAGELLDSVEADLTVILGAIDGRSETVPWNLSTFYENEMGAGLLRRFVSFRQLVSPGDLADIKLQTHEVEIRYRSSDMKGAGRRINVDPGYLDTGKIVLASTKNAGHRIYLKHGIYGETTLLYYNGGFQACPHTYPDYLWAETWSFLASLRARYLDQLKKGC
jgi:hypothetical protein